VSVSDLRVTLVQNDTVWLDAAANRELIARALREAATPTDLIVLPETFTTGFTVDAVASAEGMEGASVAWMRSLAKSHDAAVTGSIVMRVDDAVYNRLIFATPDGDVCTYDKRHLFRMAKEQEWYASGRERLVVEFRGWRICPLVCYDLRFPVYSRNGASADGVMDYDLLLYVANWPAPRHQVWVTLLRARAMENLCWVAGVNRAGTDGNGHPYQGGSTVVDWLGNAEVECDAEPTVAHAVLSYERLAEHRRRFPAWRDADRFTIDL
jgi:predicted amidohydrolase